jgi:2-oxoglutarate dehydrogenase E1 component
MIAWFEALLARTAAMACAISLSAARARASQCDGDIIKKPLTPCSTSSKGPQSVPPDVKAAGDVLCFGLNRTVFGDAALSITYCHVPPTSKRSSGVRHGQVQARQDALPNHRASGGVLGCRCIRTLPLPVRVVGEVLQLSQLPAYHIGGTIHFSSIIPVGFTAIRVTGERRLLYGYRSIGAPVLHVNADDVTR